MAIPATEFTLFPRLPVELRKEIWRLALPLRVYELDAPAEKEVFALDTRDYNCSWPCELSQTTDKNACPPLISRVCYEAREVALETGKCIVGYDLTEDGPAGCHWTSMVRVQRGWRDTARSCVHVSWTYAYEPEYGASGGSTGQNWEVPDGPLEYVAWVASRTTGVGSLMIRFLYSRYRYANCYPPSLEDQPLGAKRLRDLDALRRLSSWLVVMRVIVIHSDLATAAATGHFGLLGDAPVQVVDVSDEAKVTALYGMAEACEQNIPVLTRNQDFARDPAATFQRELKEIVLREYHAEDLAETMRPAIMFRLCTAMCNDRAISEARHARIRAANAFAHSREGRGRGRGRGRGGR